MSQSKKLNWGIVSTGKIASKFCHDMPHVVDGKIAAVAARSLNDAKAFANEHQIGKAYQGYQAMFADPNIDVIYIATPHNFHFEHASAALKAGKSVLCEKPITISSDECIKLQQLAKQRGLFLMEAMWTYFLPTILKAKQWVDEGRIGKIKHIKADFGYNVPFDADGRMYNPDLAGGCLFDMGIYPLAIAQYFHSGNLSEIVTKVQYSSTGVDNDLVVLAKSGDVTLSLATSFQCRLQNAALIIGEKGYIHIPNFWRAKSCALYQTDSIVDKFEDSAVSAGLNHEAQAVCEAVIAGKTEHEMMPLSKSLALQQQMETIRASF